MSHFIFALLFLALSVAGLVMMWGEQDRDREQRAAALAEGGVVDVCTAPDGRLDCAAARVVELRRIAVALETMARRCGPPDSVDGHGRGYWECGP